VREHEVLVFLHRGQHVLVLHRSPPQGAYWHSVAGGVEAGEDALVAAVRELEEETGLMSEAVRPLGHSYVYEGTSVTCFAAEVPSDWVPRLDWEHDEYRWCLFPEAVELLHWDDATEALRTLAAQLEVPA
jgi:8-oxo-dGTP pyrophosphatase MutT (NUDIX family)